MTTEDWTNTGAFTQQAAEAAGLAAAAKAAAENVAKATVEAANQTTKAALDNATRVLASAVEAGKAAAETGTKASASATKAATEAAENAANAFGALASGNNPTLEAAGQQVQEQTEALTAQAKQAAAAWLDLYDQGFASFVELRTSLAKASQIDAVIDLANTNTQALEQLNASFTSAVRDLLK